MIQPAAHLDHLTVTCGTLADGDAFVAAALGVAPGPGRSHPDMGTHNHVLRLGDDVYLEVMAIDPTAPPVARPRWFGLDNLDVSPGARLATWVARTDCIEDVAVSTLGQVHTMRRVDRWWKMTLTADGHLPMSGAAPALIQRDGGPHPAGALPDHGLRLRRLCIQHPMAASLEALASRIRLAPLPDVVFLQADRCRLVAEIDTPHGLRLLGL